MNKITRQLTQEIIQAEEELVKAVLKLQEAQTKAKNIRKQISEALNSGQFDLELPAPITLHERTWIVDWDEDVLINLRPVASVYDLDME